MEWSQLGISDAALAIQRGEITAEAYGEHLVRRAEALSYLNIFTAFNASAVLEAARAIDVRRSKGEALGALAGVPIAFKDNINTVALPTSAGSKALRGHLPALNAPVAQALFDAGAILFAKAGMHELALGATSNNGEYGAVRNPYDPTRVPGGSSGGSGAAVGARMVPGAIGTDTGASVRLPANYCGVSGFRPTVGRWSQKGIVPVSWTRDTAGPIARSVGDLALLDAVVAGGGDALRRMPLAGRRIGVSEDYFYENVEPEVLAPVKSALAALKDQGVIVAPIDLSSVAQAETRFGLTIAVYEMQPAMEAYLRDEGLNLTFAEIVHQIASPDVRALLIPTLSREGRPPQAAYEEAMTVLRPALIAEYRRVFSENNLDAIAHPTAALLPPPIGHDETVLLNGKQEPTFFSLIRNLGQITLAGFPSLSLPVAMSPSGLPVGLTFDGLGGNDRQLLELGLAVESVLPAPRAPLLNV